VRLKNKWIDAGWLLSHIKKSAGFGLFSFWDWICCALAILVCLGLGDVVCGYCSYDGAFGGGAFV
jgi:hypothetical protein